MAQHSRVDGVEHVYAVGAVSVSLPVHGWGVGSLAERERTSISGLTIKQDSSPIPNWPKKSERARPSSSRLEEAPMVDRSVPASCSVKPMPVSAQVRVLAFNGERDAGGGLRV